MLSTEAHQNIAWAMTVIKTLAAHLWFLSNLKISRNWVSSASNEFLWSLHLSISADDQKTFAQFEEKFKNCFYSKRDTNQDMMGLPRDAFIVDGRFRKGYR